MTVTVPWPTCSVVEVSPPNVPTVIARPPDVPLVQQVAPFTPGALVIATPGPQGEPGPPGSGTAVNQLVITGIAATALSGHRAVTRRPDGTIEYASADNPAHLNLPIWITTGAAAMGAPVDGVAYGELIEPTWSWTPGPLFLGLNGTITQTVPTAPSSVFLARIGSATDPDRMFVDRSLSITLS